MPEGVSFSRLLEGFNSLDRCSLYLRMLGEALQLKTTAVLVLFLWLINSEKLVNNRIVDHLEKRGLYSDFQYDFRSSCSTADLLKVVSDRIARAFNRSGANPGIAFKISTTFDKVWHAGLLHKLLFSVIDGFEWFCMGSLHKNIQLILEFLKAPFLVLHLSYYKLMTFLIILSAILLFMLIILLSKCDRTSDLWQKLELASELESDLRDTVDWGVSIAMLEKLNWFHLIGLITLVLVM